MMSIYSRMAWVASTILMICVNALAITLPLNSVTTKQLSDQLFTLITPAGWVFSIWSLIYVWLIVIATMIILRKIDFSPRLVWAYICSCLCNAMWIVVWHYGYLTASMLIIVWLLAALIYVDHLIQKETTSLPRWIRSVFLVYVGRVQIATLLMCTIYGMYALHLIDIHTLWRPILVLILAGATNIMVLWRARRIETLIVGLWALAGIYGWQTQVDIRSVSLIVWGMLLINLAFYVRLRLIAK